MSAYPESMAEVPVLQATDDPFAFFRDWFAEAEQSEPNDPNAMGLATAGADGMPSVRVVLLKGLDDTGFVFYSNAESTKGRQLAENPKACLNFHWKSLKRQVRINGLVEPVGDSEADAYFNSRPRGSRIGAWASQQSRPLADRAELERRVEELSARYGTQEADGPVPRPPHWTGWRVLPLRIEFWQDRPFRLHDRLVYSRETVAAAWAIDRVYP